MIDIAHGKETELGKQMGFCGQYTGEDLTLCLRRHGAHPAPGARPGPSRVQPPSDADWDSQL